MTADRWQAFARYAAWVRGKPTWDAEERQRRLVVVPRLREAVRLAADDGAWTEALLDVITSPDLSRADLTLPGHREWLRPWVESDPGGLRDALAGFADPAAPPVARFERWSRICGDAISAGRVADRRDARLAVGALFNFAADPETVPFVRQRPFRTLPGLLGEDAGEDYAAHLSFAETVTVRLASLGLACDMLDTWALILSAARNPGFWAGEGAFDEAAGTRDEPPEHYLAICAIYRDEASYMKEWVEFHRLAGVQHFYLYDNNSVDDHRELLAPYVDRGEVTIRDWPMEQGQRPAYDHCIAQNGRDARWIAFIDLDEFLFSPTGRPLTELLPAYERWPGVGANWAVFGPSGHLTRPTGLVTESYTKRLQTGENLQIKTIADPLRVDRATGVHRFTYKSLGHVDENQYPITGGTTKTESRKLLQVNHYMTKSFEEFAQRSRRSRPNPYGGGTADPFKRPFNEELLKRQDADAVPDEAILQYLPALRQRLGLD
jgi:glycosyl transferase family 92